MMRTCACGCGEVPSVKKSRYVPGHHRRKPDHYEVKDCGFETSCWVWKLATNPKGYGRVRVPNEDRKMLAHRFYFERERGPIPEGMQLDHLCRNRACVNPAHLEPVTPAENTRRGANALLEPETVLAMREMGRRSRVKDVADEFGVSWSCADHVIKRRSWRDLSEDGARARMMAAYGMRSELAPAPTPIEEKRRRLA